jgi:hypothetical protein
MMVLIYLAYVAAIFYWQLNNVKTGKCSKGKAIVLHAAYIAAPMVIYGAVFISLIGIEELTDRAIIGEAYARSLPFVIAGGVAVTALATLIFALVVLAMKQGNINSE